MSLSRLSKCFVLALLICLPIMALHAEEIYPFPTESQDAQFKHLLRDLRCLVCQNQDLADSNAKLAKDLRMEVYNQVLEGQSDHDIMTYLTERYGDFVLFKPPLKSITIFLWFAPLIFLTIGFLLYWRKFRASSS